MPRGKMEKTKAKEAVRAAAIEAEAVIVASQEVQRKNESKKDIFDNARDVLKIWITKTDPLELAAILGATYLIKQGIDWGELFVAENYDKLKGGAEVYLRVLLPFTNVLEGLIPKNDK